MTMVRTLLAGLRGMLDTQIVLISKVILVVADLFKGNNNIISLNRITRMRHNMMRMTIIKGDHLIAMMMVIRIIMITNNNIIRIMRMTSRGILNHNSLMAVTTHKEILFSIS